MQSLKVVKPTEDSAVYDFIIKKENEGKPKRVAKIAGLNKFLRIYYARVMELYCWLHIPYLRAIKLKNFRIFRLYCYAIFYCIFFLKKYLTNSNRLIGLSDFLYDTTSTQEVQS